ncbi:hypothetical protein GCM10025875_23460 [Litorihabitans aurantiacus]|uniref:Peptidase S8/S53 domain-containing protein n=1 Tax=Litorihabitans aurantiacus TaxID=1930061 RepID=A0AA37XFB9_9MICO|nr:hypothetical protein GCM10025875_23460 [Litorihabitans aurantiacus]
MRRAAARAAAGGATAALTAVLALAPVLPAPSGTGTPLATAAAATSGQCEPGARIDDAGWGPAAIGREAAGRLATGAGVRVAVVDSGVQASFPTWWGLWSRGATWSRRTPRTAAGRVTSSGTARRSRPSSRADRWRARR